MDTIKYSYAFTEEGHLICIDDVRPEDKKKNKFFCISCGKELLPRALESQKRRAHFYHKEDAECNGETYLHNLAKRLIKEKFDARRPFAFKYPVKDVCNDDSCTLFSQKCAIDGDFTLNLYDYYDTCNEEVRYNGFVADILLTHSKKANRPPLFIEVCVTHSCEQIKIDSGIKIIEIFVNSESDLRSILNQDIIDVSQSQIDNECPYGIKLYSFKSEIKKELYRDIRRFIFNPPYTIDGYITNVNCKESSYKIRNNSIVELNISESDPCRCYYYCLRWLYEHKDIKRCSICKYYKTVDVDRPTCLLSNKYPSYEQHPKIDDAQECLGFRIKDNFWGEDAKIIPANQNNPQKEFYVIIVASSDFNNYKLAEEKCDIFLSKFRDTHDIIIITDLGYNDSFAQKYAKERNFKIEPHYLDWNYYGERSLVYTRICSFAHALLALGNLKQLLIRDIITTAQIANLKIIEIPTDS